VRFIDDDDTVISEHTVEYNQDAPLPRDPVKEGSAFTGWDQSNRNIRSDRDIRAQYSERLLTVTFRDFDNRVIETFSVEFGDSAPEPVSPSREGHIFTGWSQSFNEVTTNLNVIAQYRIDDSVNSSSNNNVDNNPPDNNSSGSSNDTNSESSSNNDGNTVNNQILIQFNSLGGTTVASQTLEQGSLVQEPTNVIKSGFTLEGWYTDFSNGNVAGHKWNFNQNQVSTAIVLYANWVIIPPQNNNENSQTININETLSSAGYNTITEFIQPSTSKQFFDWLSEDISNLSIQVKLLVNRYLNSEATNTDWIFDRLNQGLSYRVTTLNNDLLHLEVFIPKVEPINGGLSDGSGNSVFYIGASYGKYYSIIKNKNLNEPMVEASVIDTIIWDDRSTYFGSSFATTTKEDLPSSKLRYIDGEFYEYYNLRQQGWQSFGVITYDDNDNFIMDGLSGNISNQSTMGFLTRQFNNIYNSYSGSNSITNISLSNENKDNIIYYSGVDSNRISVWVNIPALSGWQALGGNHNDGGKAAILTNEGLFEFSTNTWITNDDPDFIPGVKMSLIPGSSSSGPDGIVIDQFSEPRLVLVINTNNVLQANERIFEVLNLLGLEFKVGEDVIRGSIEDIAPRIANYINEPSYLNIPRAFGQNGYLLLNSVRQTIDFESYQSFVSNYEFDLYQWFEVSFETNGGNSIESRFINNTRIGHIESPVRAGYVFEGWYYDQDFLQPYDSSAVINQDTVLFAKWRLAP
jgi:uncharacterized repeat protein (TIGR02543 family)